MTYQAGGKQYVAVMGGMGATAPQGAAAQASTAAGRGGSAPAAPVSRPRLLTFVIDGKLASAGVAQ